MNILIGGQKVQLPAKARTVEQVLKDVERLPFMHHSIRTAKETNWFIDGRMALSMNGDEAEFMARYAKTFPGMKDAKVMDVSCVVPKSVGPRLKTTNVYPKERVRHLPYERPLLVSLTLAALPDFLLLVEGWRLATVVDRYQGCEPYLFCYDVERCTPRPDNTQTLPVAFSRAGKVVATIMPFLMTQNYPPLK